MTEPARSEQFIAHLTRHQGQLLAYIYALLQNMNDAEDLYQQTCLVLWRKYDEFQPGTSFIHWACHVARLEVLSLQRHQRRSRVQFSDEFLAVLAAQQADEEAEMDEARREALTECLKKLSAKDQQLVGMVYLHEQGTQAVAAALDRPAAGIYNSLSRIRKALYRCIHRQLARDQRP